MPFWAAELPPPTMLKVRAATEVKGYRENLGSHPAPERIKRKGVSEKQKDTHIQYLAEQATWRQGAS